MNSTIIDSMLRFGALWLLAVSVGILVIALLRPLVRRYAGARGVLALWWILPVAMLAVALPKEVAVEVEPSPVLIWEQAALSTQTPEASPESETAPITALSPAVGSINMTPDWRLLLLAGWLAGALSLAARFAYAQWRYARTIDWRTGSRGTLPVEDVPAVVGVFRPRIALPADFRSRYSAAERRLILLHEIVHLRRRDGLANFCMTLLRVLFWFNPLVHWAAQALGDDQETACDAAVIARHPDAIRIYAGALLRSNARVSPLPLVCHWQAYHPTVKRIAMLKQHRRGKRGTSLSRALFAFGALFAAAAVYALQPAREVQVVRGASDMNAEVSLPVEPSLPFIQGARIEPMKPLPRQAPLQFAALGTPAGNIELMGQTATKVSSPLLYVNMDIKQDGVTIQSPVVATKNGRALSVSAAGHPGQPNLDLRLLPTQQVDGSIELSVELKLSTGDPWAPLVTKSSEFKARVKPRERVSFNTESPTGSMLQLTIQVALLPEHVLKMGMTEESMPVHQAFVCLGSKTTRLPALMILLGDDVSVLALSRDDAANVLRMQGSAPSNASISRLMRDLQLSEHFEKPNLLELHAAEGQIKTFVLEFGLKCPTTSVTDTPTVPSRAGTRRGENMAINFKEGPVPALINALGYLTYRKVRGLEPLTNERLKMIRANVNADRLMRATLSCYGYALQESGGEWSAVRDAVLVPASDPSACIDATAPEEPRNTSTVVSTVLDLSEQFTVRMEVALGGGRVSQLRKLVFIGESMKLQLADDLALDCSLMRIGGQPYLRCVEDAKGQPFDPRKSVVMANIKFEETNTKQVVTRYGKYLLEFSVEREPVRPQQD